MCLDAKTTVRRHENLVLPPAQLRQFQAGQLGVVQSVQLLDNGAILRLVCSNGTVNLGIHPEHGRAAVKALVSLDCNLGHDAIEMDFAPAAEHNQEAINENVQKRLRKLMGQ